MDRTNGAGHVNHLFVEQDAATNRPPTEITAEWMNGVQEELVGLILAVGLPLSAADQTQLVQALIKKGMQGAYFNTAVDTGAANAYVAVFAPALAAPVPGAPLWIKIKTTNTGASTLNVTGTAYPWVGAAHSPLQGGELIADGWALTVWKAELNSYVLCWCTGAPEQVAPATKSGHAATLGQVSASVQDFRLSLSTGVPVTAADVAAAGTVYLTPYKGNKIGFADGSILTSAEVSIAVPAVANQMYDVFAYNNGGALALELLAWTNDTTRATALVMSNGMLVKTGATTRRYVGSFRTIAASQTEDSQVNRYVWNYYNRVRRTMRRIEPTTNWTYGAAAWRQANGNTANQINFVVGVAEDPVEATLMGSAMHTTVGAGFSVSFGLDATTAEATGVLRTSGNAQVANSLNAIAAAYSAVPTAGKHYLAWIELTSAATATFYGQSVYGMNGVIFG